MSDVGRPTKFDASFVQKAKDYASDGLTDEELSELLGISRTTLWTWKTRHPEFANALKAGKSVADDRVEDSLYHRAVGYTFDAERIQVLRDGAVVRVPYREHVPPDTTAAIFWLKNRRPE